MKFFEDGPPVKFHIGLRIIKTVIATFICALIGYWRGQVAFYSMIAAIVCMQASTQKSFAMAFNRTVGTIIGGLVGLGVLYLLHALPIEPLTPLYFLIVCIMLIPVIMITVLIKKPSISYLTCVVFLSVTVTHISDSSLTAFAFHRIADTLVGIVVALLINLIIPGGRAKEDIAQAGDAAAPEEGIVAENIQEPQVQCDEAVNLFADMAGEESFDKRD